MRVPRNSSVRFSSFFPLAKPGLILSVLLCLLAGYGFADEKKSKSFTEVVVINEQQAKRLHDLGAMFIDVRSEEEWRLGHIEDARNVNFRKNFAKLKDMDGIDQDTPLVFYCASRECKTGPYASAVSIEWGFENVFYFQRGYFAWMLKDYPISLNNQVTTVTSGTIQIRRAPGYNPR